MIEVEVSETGDVLEFPDGTSDEVIGRAVRSVTQGRIKSAGNAFMAGGGVGTGKSMSGLARFFDKFAAGFAGMDPTGTGLAIPSPEQSGAAVEEMARRRRRTPEQVEAEISADPLYQAGMNLAEGAREAFPTNPKFEGEMFADILPGAAGQMLPTLTAALANPAFAVGQYSMASGQDGAEDAIASGRPDLAQDAFLANAPIGALTEAALGPIAHLRTLRRVAKAKGVGAATLRGTVRESAQEGLEQVGGNLVASDVVGFDPERPVQQGVGTAMVAGGLLGGGVGGVAGLTTLRPFPKDEAPPPVIEIDEDANELPAPVDPPAEAPIVEPVVEPVVDAAPAPEITPTDPPVGEAAAVVEPTPGAAVTEAVPEVVATDPDPKFILSADSPAVRNPSAIWEFDQWALQRLNSMDQAIRSQTYSDPLLVTPMAQAVIQAANGLIRTGMALEPALRQALVDVRARMPDAPDNDELLGQAMARGLGTRQFVDQLSADPQVSDTLRAEVSNRIYVRQPNEDSAAFAGRIVDAVGIDQGMMVFRDRDNGLDMASRTMLGQLITRRLATAEVEARNAGRMEEAAALAQRAGLFLNNDLLGYSTDLAQGLQAFSAFRFVTPAATIDWARRQIEHGARQIQQENSSGTDAVVDGLNRINDETIDGATTAPQVQRAGADAVDSAVVAQAQSGTGPVADAMRIEATNNMEMLPSMRRALTQARVRALQQVAQRSGYWQRIVNTSARQLERRLADLMGGPRPANATFTVSDLASQLTAVLGQQLNASIGIGNDPASVANRTRPDNLMRLRQILANSERMSEIWRQLRESIAGDPRFNDPRVAAALAQGYEAWSAPLLRRVIDQSLEAQGVTIMELARRGYRLREGALGQRLINELGLDPSIAQRLVTAADDAYRQAFATAAGTIPNRLRAIRRTPSLIRALRTGLIDPTAMPVNEVDRALADAMIRSRLDLGRIVRQHYRQVDGAGRYLAARLVADAGVSGPAADALAAAVRTEFSRRVDGRRRRELDRIAASATRTPRRVRQAWERLVELSNLGAVNRADAWNVIAERMDLPEWTPALAADVRAIADEIQVAPEGIPQQRAVQRLLDRLARERLRWWDFPIALWYANILSGPVTHLRNILGNAGMMAANALVSLRRPQDWPAQMVAMGRGLGVGSRDAYDVLRTGRLTGFRSNRAEAARPLELMRLPGRLDYMLTFWRMVGRGLGAADTLFFRAAAEQRAELMSRLIARREGLRGDALARRVAEIMGRTDAQRAAAETQALAEGLTGNDLARRVTDIMDRQRPEDVRTNARDFGLRSTFNNEPYGVLGAAARAMNQLSADVPAVRAIVPFTNIIANVVNEGLNWFPPTGVGRSIWGHWQGRLNGQEITNMEDLYDQHARAALGTVLVAGLYAAIAAAMDDDDPWIDITSMGPKDAGQRAQLRMRGWMPKSIKIGDRWYSYQNTPMVIPMAWLGNWFDARRYNKLETRDLTTRLAYAVANTGQVILSHSFLDGMASFLGGLRRDDPKGAARMMEGFARSATSIVVPNALRQLDRAFDPTVYDSHTMTAALVNSVPFARRTGQPALNVWGQPVEISQTETFVSQVQEDPVLDVLARRGLWISTPTAQIKVDGEPLTPDEIWIYTKARGPRLHQLLSNPGVLNAMESIPTKAADNLLSRVEAAANVMGQIAVREHRRKER